MAVLGDFVFFGGIKWHSSGACYATLLKVKSSDGSIEFYYEYENDANYLNLLIERGNFGFIDSDGNVLLLNEVYVASSDYRVILYKVSGENGSPIVATILFRSVLRSYVSDRRSKWRVLYVY